MLTKDRKKMEAELKGWIKGKTRRQIQDSINAGAAARANTRAKVKIKCVCLVDGEKKGLYDVAALGLDEKLYDIEAFDDYDEAMEWALHLCDEYERDEDHPIRLEAVKAP